VCRIHDLGTAPASRQCTESQFVSLESLPGESLSARLCRGPLSPAELLLVAQHLAEALRAFHEQGLAHGAVEAENVWLREAEGAFEAVLCSFQTAREVAEEPTAGRTSSPTSGPRLQRDYASDASPQARALFASDVAALGRLLRRLTPSSGTPYSPGGAVVKGPSAEVPGSGEHAPCFELAWQALLDECERAPRALPRRGAERALWRAHELERVHRGLLFAARPGAALAEPVRRDAHG
jgi:serine/threonine protein kinase